MSWSVPAPAASKLALCARRHVPRPDAPVCRCTSEVSSLSRRGALLTGVALPLLVPAGSPALAAEELSQFTARCGARMQVPAAWVVASDRESAGDKPQTLLLLGDFSMFDTVSLRRELPPPDAASSLDGSLSAAQVASLLTAPERAAVASGTAVGNVPGVVQSSSGTISFSVLDSSSFSNASGAPYYVVETRQEQCRGLVSEGRGGAVLCEGPRGDELPTIQRRAVVVYHYQEPFLFCLRASCVEERWAEVGPLLRRVATSMDTSGVA